MMKYLKTFEATWKTSAASQVKGKGGDPKLQTKQLNELEFLKLFTENCKNFSFENDQLYRSCNSKYPFSLFTEIERLGSYGKYGQYPAYADLFQKIETDRENYPVLRTHSLVGSTDNCIWGTD